MACRVYTPQCWSADWQQCSQSVAVMDVKWYSQFNSLLNMLRTIFIIAVLAAGVFVFNRDASRLVLEPIERMLKKVKDVSENPLAVKQVRAISLASLYLPSPFHSQGGKDCSGLKLEPVKSRAH